MFADDVGGGANSVPQVLETFKFNFTIDGQHDDTSSDQPNAPSSHTTTTIQQHPSTHTSDPSTLIPGHLHHPTSPTSHPFPSNLQPGDPAQPSRLPITATYAPYRLPVPTTASSSHQLTRILRHSDVIPSVYEGGYKVWECSIDLCRYLGGLRAMGGGVGEGEGEGVGWGGGLDCERVLELGCGHGLCGLWTLLEGGAGHVTFHDLNPEVITDLTIPHIALNLSHTTTPPLSQHATLAQLTSRTTFLSGDWSAPSLRALLAPARYTLLLTSDTLYQPASIAALLSLIRRTLAPYGTALIASKRYYFGVGGGTVELLDGVGRDGGLVGEVVAVLEDGVSNIREIVKLTWKDGRVPVVDWAETGGGGTEGDGVAMTDQ